MQAHVTTTSIILLPSHIIFFENEGAAAALGTAKTTTPSALVSTSIDNADVGRYRGKEGNVYRITDAFPNKSKIDSESHSPRLLRPFCLFRERTL
jgi:hypothetical protein